MKKIYVAQLSIPQGVEVKVENNTIFVKGTKGSLERTFLNPRIVMVVENGVVIFKNKNGVRFSNSDKMFMNTYKAHVRNMFIGVQEGYKAKLKICSGHFPMTVTVEGNSLVIKNFLGEKVPRKTSFVDGVSVKVQGDLILVDGLDKEKVGQTAAKIEQNTRITNRDRRIFQDGCFIILKPGDEE